MDLGINLILKCKPKLKPLSIFECICLGFDLGLVLGFLGFLGLGLGLDSKTHVFFGGKTSVDTELHQALSPKPNNHSKHRRIKPCSKQELTISDSSLRHSPPPSHPHST